MARRWERDRPLERPCPVPPRDAAELRTTRVRMTGRVATTGPNAPLLIRLVRHPYALDVVRPKKVVYRGENAETGPRASTHSRVDWHAEFRAALAERERMRSTSGVELRPLPFTIRPSLWQLLPPVARGWPERKKDKGKST